MNSLDKQENVETQHGDHQPREGTILTDAGIIGELLSHDDNDHNRRTFGLPIPPLYWAMLPALLPGTRCYTDASMTLDCPNEEPCRAGLGIFIIDPQQRRTIYIKAVMTNSTSVLMTESCCHGSGRAGDLSIEHTEHDLPNKQSATGVLQWDQLLLPSYLGHQAIHSELH